MAYKRPYQSTKKYLPAYGAKKNDSQNIFGTGYDGDFLNIPMPNEREGFKNPWGKGKGPRGLGGIVSFLKEHIGIEEIILIGLIILLLDESIEDDFLLVILIYILLF